MKDLRSTGCGLIYLAESSTGGIAEYAVMQIKALARQGVEVRVLCRPDFPHDRLGGIQVCPILPVRREESSFLRRLWSYIRDARRVAEILGETVQEHHLQYVLMDCFREYLAPFWVGRLKTMHRNGIRFGVVAHDPVRDFVVGPSWWHRYSIRTAYSFIDDVFVHDATRIDFGGPKPPRIRVHSIPHGPLRYPDARQGRNAMREKYGFKPGDVVFLSFGQIRDGKNIDQFIRAMPALPESVKLVVAGKGGAHSQKPPEYYRELAGSLSVSNRCVWELRYIPEEDIADLFVMSDVVLLTYSGHFVSASGVLNTAVHFRRPVLASGGEGPLKRAVSCYPIGVWTDGGSADGLVRAAIDLIRGGNNFEFDCYCENHSWSANANTVAQAVLARQFPPGWTSQVNNTDR